MFSTKLQSCRAYYINKNVFCKKVFIFHIHRNLRDTVYVDYVGTLLRTKHSPEMLLRKQVEIKKDTNHVQVDRKFIALK